MTARPANLLICTHSAHACTATRSTSCSHVAACWSFQSMACKDMMVHRTGRLCSQGDAADTACAGGYARAASLMCTVS